MGKLLLVSTRCRKGLNWKPGDVIQWLADDICEKMIANGKLTEFDIVDTELSEKEYLDSQTKTKRLYKARTLELTEVPPDVFDSWRDEDGSYKKVLVQPKFQTHFEKGELKNAYSQFPENNKVTLIDQKGDIVG